MDHHLSALVAAVESGASCPSLRLILASGIIVGTPVASGDFWIGTQAALVDALTKRSKVLRKLADRDPSVEADVNATIRGIQGVGESKEPTAITLADAVWIPSRGDGLDLPHVRVPIAAVDAWFIARAESIKAGSAYSFGAIIPTGS